LVYQHSAPLALKMTTTLVRSTFRAAGAEALLFYKHSAPLALKMPAALGLSTFRAAGAEDDDGSCSINIPQPKRNLGHLPPPQIPPILIPPDLPQRVTTAIYDRRRI
jgi:hypothetical protein